MAIALLAVAAGATAYSAIEQKKGADAAAQVDSQTAAYNARYDAAMADQLDLDTQQNIRTERQNDAVYLSKQSVGYASAGVLATSGSALDAQITNAGRMEQQIQQQWVNAQQKEEQYYAAADAGLAAGAAQASADRLSGSIALINGVSQIAGMAASGYQKGMFGGGGGSDNSPIDNPEGGG